MFESIELAPADPILGLNEGFQKDDRAQKINLSVGVYKDAAGTTPVLSCVKQAERKLLESETTKSYLSISGLPGFNQHVQQLLFGDQHPIVQAQRAVTLQSPGGTGALRIAGDFIRRRFPKLPFGAVRQHGSITRRFSKQVDSPFRATPTSMARHGRSTLTR